MHAYQRYLASFRSSPTEWKGGERVPHSGDRATGSAPRPTQEECTIRRILVVDDNVDLAQSLQLLLQSFGYEVYCANDGEEALAAAREFKPDAAIVDIGLPRVDGLEVARRLRHMYDERDLLLIAATGYGAREDKLRSREAGFDYHLVKPVDVQRLRTIMALHNEV